MSSLEDSKPRPAQFIENGHETGLRSASDFCFNVVHDIAKDAVVDVRFLTGDLAVEFLSAVFDINQELVIFEVFEDTIYSAPGTINPNIGCQMNRMSSRQTELEFYEAPTITSDGTLFMRQDVLGVAGQNVSKPGFGSGVVGAERILKPNTEHLFRITNSSALTSKVVVHIVYKEVNPKEYS